MKLSVVTVVRAGSQPVLSLLASLQNEAPAEIIVVNCCGPAVAEAIAERFPDYEIVEEFEEATSAQARYAGVKRSTGGIVAIVHERYRIPERWLAAVEAVHQRDIDAAGGGIAPAPEYGAMEWAMYLTEYSQVAPPLPDGLLDLKRSMLLPGGNISYKRRVFDMAPMGHALSELDFHEALYHAGARFYRCQAMDVQFASSLTLEEYREERRKFSRAYGALRFRDASAASRALGAGARLALPPLLLARYARQTFANAQLRGKFWPALPWMTYFAWIQMQAEMAGILNGSVSPPRL